MSGQLPGASALGKPSLGLRAIVAGTIAMVAIGLTLAGGLFASFTAKRMLEREIGLSLAGIANSMMQKLDHDMWHRAVQVAVLSRLESIRDPAQAQHLIDELTQRDPTLAWAGVTDADGQVLAASRGVLVGSDISTRPVHAEGMKGPFVGDVHDAVMLSKLLPNPTGEPMKFVDVSAPLRDETGRVAGVLAVHYSWAWARQAIAGLASPYAELAGLAVFVVSADRNIILGPDGSFGSRLELATLAAARPVARGWGVETWPDGISYVTGLAPSTGVMDFPGLGWTVIVRQPADIAFGPALMLERWFLVTGLVFVVLFSAIGWFAAGRIARPLERIALAAEGLRRQEPGAAIPSVSGPREVRQLARSLQELVISLLRKDVALARLQDAAHHDPLTGLPNRRFFENHLAVATARPRDGALVVMALDLDGFKPINDQHGHATGDIMLKQTAQRLAACLRGNDVVARLGGDEFTVLIQAGPDAGHTGLDMAERLIEAVNQPVLVGGQPLRVGCSIGLAHWPADAPDIRTVAELADAALYVAKRAGKNQARVHGIGDAAPGSAVA